MSSVGSKKLVRSGGRDGDLISNLPDCVLSYILSCLPTKDAVRTCVLSKFWEYKWTSIYNIDIEDQVSFSEMGNDKACFMKFMDRILLHSQNIRSFDLWCHGNYDGSRVETWMSALFRRNVETVISTADKPIGRVVVSRSLLYCTSLRKLSISMVCTLKVPAKICFTNLTNLYLEEVDILNDNPSTDTLKFDFPLLATLGLTRCRWLKVKVVEFCAPCLSSFVADSAFDVPSDDYLILISGAQLDMFKCRGVDVENIRFTGSRVRYAYFHVLDEIEEDVVKIGLRTRKLLTELSSISRLELNCYIAQAIARAKAGHHLPKFDKLGKLVLNGGTNLRNHIANIEALFELLHAAPYLEDLDVDMGDVVFMETQDGYDYDAMASVQSCIVSHLKTVKV